MEDGEEGQPAHGNQQAEEEEAELPGAARSRQKAAEKRIFQQPGLGGGNPRSRK